MRKNSARKWLHFTLDLLPVIAIPVFMIYSHRHSLTERTNVEVNYKYETNDVNSADDLVIGNIYHFDITDDSIDSFVDFDDENGNVIFTFVNFTNYDFSNYNVAFDDFVHSIDLSAGNIAVSLRVNYGFDGLFEIYTIDNDINDYTFSLTFNNSLNSDIFTLVGDFVLTYFENTDFYNVDFISASDFNVIESVNADTTNENILNVFYKDFTDTIDNYFNFDNVFTFGDIWQWFNTNMFGGNASPIAHAIYEIIVYEFIIDIMFLSYAVFMFIIDFTTDTLERFTGWSSRG